MGIVLWKPLYITSVLMFILSLVLLPFSMKWSVIVIISLVTLWSRVPGFVHFIFNKISMHDLFGYIVAATAGIWIGVWFTFFVLWGARLFGPTEWTPYTVRATISGLIGVFSVPMLLSHFGGITVMGFIWFQIIQYSAYYIMILLFFRHEIVTEIICLPGVIFFDFVLTIEILGIFGDTITDMMINGIESGWPFVILAGIIIMLLFIAKNAEKWGSYLLDKIKIIIPDKKDPDEEKEEDKDKEGLDEYDRFLEGYSDVNRRLVGV